MHKMLAILLWFRFSIMPPTNCKITNKQNFKSIVPDNLKAIVVCLKFSFQFKLNVLLKFSFMFSVYGTNLRF